MTPTDKLRALLDEMGVEWQDFDGEPTWMDSDGRMHYARYEFTFNGPTDELTVYHLTPEQAIAATVGADYGIAFAPTLERPPETMVGETVFDAEGNAIGWITSATVGVGACHMRLAYEEEDADGCIWPDHYECDACGAKVNGIMSFYDTEIPPRFCPNCRREVVSE